MYYYLIEMVTIEPDRARMCEAASGSRLRRRLVLSAGDVVEAGNRKFISNSD